LRKLLRKAARSLAQAGGADSRDLEDEPEEVVEALADPLPALTVVTEPA
jgi:hypothetical protein